MDSTQVKNVRKTLGLTQPLFGQLLGVHPMTVSKWERGELEPSEYQQLLIDEFYKAAKKKEVRDNLNGVLLGAGIAAALYLLLKGSRD